MIVIPTRAYVRAALTLAIEPCADCGRADCVCERIAHLVEPDFVRPGEPTQIVKRWDGWGVQVLSDCGRFWISVDPAGECWNCACTEDNPCCFHGVTCAWTNEHRNLCDGCSIELGLEEEVGGSNREIANDSLADYLNHLLLDWIDGQLQFSAENLAGVLRHGTPIAELTLEAILVDEFWRWQVILAKKRLEEGLPWRGATALPPSQVTVTSVAGEPVVMSGHKAVATRDFLLRLPTRDRAQECLLEALQVALERRAQ